jgi:hypothetical protein
MSVTTVCQQHNDLLNEALIAHQGGELAAQVAFEKHKILLFFGLRGSEMRQNGQRMKPLLL